MTNEPTRPLPENPSDDTRLTPPVPPMPEPSKAQNLRPEPPEPRQNATLGEEIGALGAESRQRGGETSGRETSGGPERELARPGPRTGPIVWGALILVFCAYVAQQVFGTDGLDAAGWITLAAIGVGALLLAVGVAVLVRNRSLAKRPDSR